MVTIFKVFLGNLVLNFFANCLDIEFVLSLTMKSRKNRRINTFISNVDKDIESNLVMIQ